ncbi:MAG: hypothetical protein F6K32_18095 [Desertifilum sp. SIO1I2]|nr:hypothetical protein [Desertifilum sp. SIO1I2]
MPHALTVIGWMAIAILGDTAAILGSLMMLGALLLWLVPHRQQQSSWSSRLKLLGIAGAIALFGILLLLAVPFPYPIAGESPL